MADDEDSGRSTDREKAPENDVEQIIQDELDRMDEMIDELIREKKTEIIQEKVQEELAKILHQNTEKNGSTIAS